MSALKQVFPRVHYRYDECPYADDLEHFAAWLCVRIAISRPARTCTTSSDWIADFLRRSLGLHKPLQSREAVNLC
jgi:hypothetical protein